jgi:drug/metabolite transporter (DMT)-like permease
MRASNIDLPSAGASSPSLRLPLPALVAAFCLLWASAFSVAKLAVAECPPLTVLAARFLLAGTFMLGAAAIYGAPRKLSRRDVLIFALLGIANQAAYLDLSYVGIRSISSGLAALIVSANPVLTAVMAAAFLNERMTWRKASSLFVRDGVNGHAGHRRGGELV